MFARTKRLTLRPPWPEDAPALATAIGHKAVCRNLARVPFPYSLADAQAFIAAPRGPEDAVFVILAHDGGPRLIGGIGLHAEGQDVQLGYWLTPHTWGRGYATEAGRAVVEMAREALPLRRLQAWHFADNAASGRVLAKLGFGATGECLAKASLGRGGIAPAVAYSLDLVPADAPMLAAA